MKKDNFNNLTNEKLVELAGETVIGTTSGLKAQYAQAELIKRLMDSINGLNKTTSRYSDKLLGLTIVLFFIAFVQLTVSLKSFFDSWMLWILSVFIVSYAISAVMKMIEKEIWQKNIKL